MNKVPSMISSKDLDYIKDMLNWNFIVAKKTNHYLEHIQDEEVKKAISATCDMHKKHYRMLLSVLK